MKDCLLCGSTETTLLFARRDNNGRRDFYVCSRCDLVFVPGEFHVSLDEERERYLTHNNDPDDVSMVSENVRLSGQRKCHLYCSR